MDLARGGFTDGSRWSGAACSQGLGAGKGAGTRIRWALSYAVAGAVSHSAVHVERGGDLVRCHCSLNTARHCGRNQAPGPTTLSRTSKSAVLLASMKRSFPRSIAPARMLADAPVERCEWPLDPDDFAAYYRFSPTALAVRECLRLRHCHSLGLELLINLSDEKWGNPTLRPRNIQH